MQRHEMIAAIRGLGLKRMIAVSVPQARLQTSPQEFSNCLRSRGTIRGRWSYSTPVATFANNG